MSLLRNCHFYNPGAGYPGVLIQGGLGPYTTVPQETIDQYTNQTNTDGTIIMGPFWEGHGNEGSHPYTFRHNIDGLSLRSAEYDIFLNSQFFWGQGAGTDFTDDDSGGFDLYNDGVDSYVRIFVKPDEGYVISTDSPVNDNTYNDWNDTPVGVNPTEWLTGITFHNTVHNGGFGEGVDISPDNLIEVRINLNNDYIVSPGDLFRISIVAIAREARRRPITVCLIEDVNTRKNSGSMNANTTYPLTLEVIEEPGVVYMNKFTPGDYCGVRPLFEGFIDEGSTYALETADDCQRFSPNPYSPGLYYDLGSGLGEPFSEQQFQQAQDGNVFASLVNYDETGNATSNYGQVSANDRLHYFHTIAEPGVPVKLATIKVSIDTKDVEWGVSEDSGGFTGFIEAASWSPPLDNPNFTYTAEGLFYLKNPDNSNNGSFIPITGFTGGWPPEKYAMEAQNVHDKRYYTFVNPAGQTEGVLYEFKFDLMFTETEVGSTNVNSNAITGQAGLIRYSSLGRNIHSHNYNSTYDAGGLAPTGSALDCYNVYTSYHLGIDSGGVVGDCVSGESLSISKGFAAFNLPGSRVWRRNIPNHDNLAQVPWIHPDYAMNLFIFGDSKFEIIAQEISNSEPAAGARPINLLSINKFRTNLEGNNTFSNYILPSEGIRKNNRPTCEVLGKQGAQFTIKLNQSKIVEINSGAGRSTSSSSPTDIELSGGVIPEMPSGIVSIPKTGCYKFLFPEIEALTVTEGWREFEFEIEAVDKTQIMFLSDVSSNVKITNENLEGKQNGFHGATLKFKVYQLPEASVSLSASGLHAGASYITNYNITDVPSIGKKNSRNLLKPLLKTITSSRRSRRNPSVKFEKKINVAIEKGGSTFSLITSNLIPIKDKSGNVVHYKVPQELFVPVLPTSSNVRSTDINPETDNMDVVEFDVIAKVGGLIGDNSSTKASIIGTYKLVRAGLRPQTYDINLSKIFINS